MDRDIKNKTVVITGGAEGIGFEIANGFLKNGAKAVIILDVNEAKGIAAVKELNSTYGGNKADYFKCDVTKDLEAIFERVIQKYKVVDVLVNNAGILDESNLRKTIEINLIALMEWTFKFWEHMRTDKGGKGGTIINMSSIYGFRTDPFAPIYLTSKYAVMGFTKSMGDKYNFDRLGVRVVALCPGLTRTTLVHLIKPFDPETAADYTELREKKYLWQDPPEVGLAAVEVFKRADSGTAWLIEGGKPIEQVQ